MGNTSTTRREPPSPRRGVERWLAASVPRKATRDMWNRLRYGPGAPRSDEVIYVDPRTIIDAHDGTRAPFPLRRKHSGQVLGGDWGLFTRAIPEANIESCRLRYTEGVDWEDTPVFAEKLAKIAAGEAPDGCRTREELRARYDRLDKVVQETLARGRLLTRAELPEVHFRREHGGIMVHVTRDGTLLRGGGGTHRFAIARVLGLPEIPAQIGAVHPEALRIGVLDELRIARHPAGR